MPQETIEIKYLIKAIDEATATMKKVEKSSLSMKKSLNETEKATKAVEKEQKSYLTTIQKVASTVEDSTSSIKRFYDMLTNFDYKKLIRFLGIIGMLLKFKGMSKSGGFFLKLANKNVLCSHLLKQRVLKNCLSSNNSSIG